MSNKNLQLLTESNLTATQLALWLGQQRHPGEPIYNMVHTFTIKGCIDPHRFQRAFQILVNKCDVLRTQIKETGGIPQQYVVDDVTYLVEIIDLSPDTDQHSSLDLWIERRKTRRLNLEQCHYDSVLLKLTNEEYVWYYSHHHITCDMLSVELIYGYLSHIYDALSSESVPIPVIPSYFNSSAFTEPRSPNQRAVHYWSERLSDLPQPIEIYGRPIAAAGSESARFSLRIGTHRSGRIRELMVGRGFRALTAELSYMNFFMALLAVTVHRVSGQSRFTIGAPFHNRPDPIAKSTPGLFIQLLPIFAQVDNEETLRTFAPQILRHTLTAMAHSTCGEQVLEQASTFNVVLNFLTADFGQFAGMDSEFNWIHSGFSDSNHALRLQIHHLVAEDDFLVHFDLNCNIFDQSAAACFQSHMLMILDAVLDDPDLPVGRIQLLTEKQRQSLLIDFNNTNQVDRDRSDVIELFQQQASSQPNEVAILHDNRSLTYLEFDRLTDGLCLTLRREGIHDECLIGICMHRSIEALIAIFGVLKAGAAYVPIDPAYPPIRIRQILEEINAPFVITQDDLGDRLEQYGTDLLIYQSCDDTWLRHNSSARSIDDPLSPVASAKSKVACKSVSKLAYVMFTSGSTGRPKGVMISHTSLTNYICWARDYYLGEQRLAFPLFSSLAFDLTVTSIFVPLVSGGRIVIYGEEEGANDLAIMKVMADNAVDIIKLTPAHLSLINEMKLRPNRLHKMIVGGEVFHTQLALRTLQLFGGDLEIFNEYGPTEATVGSMIHHYQPVHDTETSVPIGIPIDNTQIYVVDQYDNPVPPLVIGEIVISGAGVSHGYLNHPDLNEVKFARLKTLPEAAEERRFYHTGDLARWSSSGELEFLGRNDFQIKLRGYRIELGEIEAALLANPQISEAVVAIVQPDNVENLPDQAISHSVEHCRQCGLPSNYPNADFDNRQLCSLCRKYTRYAQKIDSYFKGSRELQEVIDAMKRDRSGDYDCIMLMSGGKDSTYVLCQLVEMGLNPLVFTLDNGFISDQAKQNICRVSEHLQVDHLFATTPHMNDIFVDSLKRYSNVCNGCFKTIYTLSLKLARERGIGYIVTGLARGQLFETRLSEELFMSPKFDVERIDAQIQDARKAYHRQRDLISARLNEDLFIDDSIFTEVQFVDYYRYTNVSLDEMLNYLADRVPWVRPEDTGRSTNCLINDVGIYVHKKQKGYHNYALPYSWDVRLGHKNRETALKELDDDIDEQRVHQILDEIGYAKERLSATDTSRETSATEPRLVAYYVADKSAEHDAPSHAQLRDQLARMVPLYMVPGEFVRLQQMPLTTNGKIDRAKLPHRRGLDVEPDDYVPPESELESLLAKIWQEILHLPRIGIHTNFFDIGGTSLPAIQIVTRVSQEFDIDLPLRVFFSGPTIAELSTAVEEIILSEIEALSDNEAARLIG